MLVSEVQPVEPQSNFQVMPTPRIGLTSAADFANYGPTERGIQQNINTAIC